MMNGNLLIVGAGSYALVAAEVAQSMGCFGKIGFVDDRTKTLQNGACVVGTTGDIDRLAGEYSHIIVGIGNPEVRLSLLKELEKKEQYPISAWRSTALRLAQLAKPGTRITIKGYLSQHLVGQTTMIEVTAEEFQVSGPFHHPSSPIPNIPNEHKEEQHEK